MTEIDYSRTCFVAMPYGPRRVGRRTVDFDTIYQEIFRNAVKRVKLNGLSFLPRRADDAVHSRILVHEMLTTLIRSRLMLADVSVDNTNVGAEIAARYAWVPSGTVLVRIKGTRVPFDFAQVQVTDYLHEPEELIRDSQARIAQALRATLKFASNDNMFFEHGQTLARAMGTPAKPTELGDLLVDAELAVRKQDFKTATNLYLKAERIHPDFASLPRRRATLLVAGGSVDEAQEAMRKALKIEPEFPAAERWLGQIKRGKVPKPSYLETVFKIDAKQPKTTGQIKYVDLDNYVGIVIQPDSHQVLKKIKNRRPLTLKDAERMAVENILGKGGKVKGMDSTRDRRPGRGGRSRGGNFSER